MILPLFVITLLILLLILLWVHTRKKESFSTKSDSYITMLIPTSPVAIVESLINHVSPYIPYKSQIRKLKRQFRF